MKKIHKNLLYLIIILLLTLSTIIILKQFPNYFKPANEQNLPFTLKWIIVFVIADAVLIGIPAWVHKQYVKDYTAIKSIWFFALFGGITGALLGERGMIIMIIPYTILMIIYALFYKKFIWWKVALTTYLAGIIIENIINRSPIQSPTLIWVAFFIYPYFITKIWENRKKVPIVNIIKNLKYTIFFSIILGALAIYINIVKSNSPPLIFISIVLPFIITIIYRFIKNINKKHEKTKTPLSRRRSKNYLKR